MPDNMVTEEQFGAALKPMFDDFHRKMQNEFGQKFTILDQMTEKVGALDEVVKQQGVDNAEFKAREADAAKTWAMVQDTLPQMQNEIRSIKARNSDDTPRTRVAGNRYSGMRLESVQAAKTRILLSSEQNKAARLQELNAAVNESKFDQNDVERLFDVLDKQLAGVGGKGPILERLEAQAMGREPGNMVSDPDNPNVNMLHSGIDAALTTASGSGAAIIPTAWSAVLWAEMNLMGENFFPALAQRTITTATENIPSFGADAWGQMRVEAQTGNRRDATFSFHNTSVTAYPLEVRTFVSQDVLDDANVDVEQVLRTEFPELWLDGAQEAVITADINGTPAQNVNLAARTAPAPNAPVMPEDIGFNGLQSYALADSDAQSALGGAFTDANTEDQLDDLRNLLDWGAAAPEQAFFLMALKERQAIRRHATTYLTLQNVGQALATAINGDLRRVGGMEIYTPRSFPLAWTDAGRIDRATPANNDKGNILAVSRSMATLVMRAMPQFQVYQAANMSAPGIYPGIRGRFGFVLMGYDPGNRGRRTNILRGDARGVAILHNITRP